MRHIATVGLFILATLCGTQAQAATVFFDCPECEIDISNIGPPVDVGEPRYVSGPGCNTGCGAFNECCQNSPVPKPTVTCTGEAFKKKIPLQAALVFYVCSYDPTGKEATVYHQVMGDYSDGGLECTPVSELLIAEGIENGTYGQGQCYAVDRQCENILDSQTTMRCDKKRFIKARIQAQEYTQAHPWRIKCNGVLKCSWSGTQTRHDYMTTIIKDQDCGA